MKNYRNISKRMKRLHFLLRMAWRDSRKNRSRLMLFLTSIILGIAALVAINGFRTNLESDINDQAKELLGADYEIHDRTPLPDSIEALLSPLKAKRAEVRSFLSMAFFPKNNSTRLVQVRGLAGNYPFYGSLETTPAGANKDFRKGKRALVDHNVMIQYDASVGDSIRLGESTFVIAGRLKGTPGRSAAVSTASPIVYIPMQYLEETNLVQKGSRVFYRYYFQFGENFSQDKKLKEIEEQLDLANIDFETVESNKEDYSRSFENLTGFLNLVGFIALLLGCVGVASTVNIYIKEKIPTVAILRCVGVSGKEALLIFLVQIIGMGMIGSVTGALLGTGLSYLTPALMQDFLPVQLEMSIAWQAIAVGISTGLLMAVLFALIPLLSIQNISPMHALRASYEKQGKTRGRWWIYSIIFIFIFCFSLWQIGDLQEALVFTGGLVAAAGFLVLMAWLLTWTVRKYFPRKWGFIWRQAIANLYRPNNQTVVLITSIGLGTAFIALLTLMQGMLLKEVQFSGSGDQPNMLLFDIQPDQVDEVVQFTRDKNMPVKKLVPMVTMRLSAVNGKPVNKLLADSTLTISRNSLTREYRVTYRDSLTKTEKLTNGEWTGMAKPGKIVPISIHDEYAERMELEIGDRLTFNVQGTAMETRVASFREIDWNSLTTNFLVVFPKGVLEQAPQIYILVTKTTGDEQNASYQQELVQRFANVSIIDLNLILETLKDILGKIAFVILFMASFSIITGLVVLVGAIVVSKYQRIQESVILRTLGGSRKQILWINGLEYMLLGALSAITGIIIAFIASWALAKFSFEIGFRPEMVNLIWVFLGVTILTTAIGMFNSRNILTRPPLEVLRKEVTV